MPAEAKLTGPAAALEAARQFLSTLTTPGLILVAVSGGSDSKGLLLALHEAITSAGPAGFSLAACTVDHALRAESAQEAEVMAQFCTSRGIVHVTRRWEGEKPSTGLQASARIARYALLADVARETGAICIVTGHSRNDQIETIAMRKVRSDSDGPGLSGMADAVLFDRAIWILRPFLDLGRAEIRDYLVSRGEGWFDDPSNVSDRFERARVRRILADDDHGATAAADLAWRATAAGRQAIAENAAALLAQHARILAGLVARIDPVLVAAVTSPDASRAILSLAACIGGRTHLPGRDTTDRLVRFLKGDADGRVTAGRVVFDRRRSGLYLYREARNLPILTVAAGERCRWDGRFLVTNNTATPFTLSEQGLQTLTAAGLIAAGVPEGVAARAARAAFWFSPSDSVPEAADRPDMAPCLSPWDTFLPRFDLILANQCAALFGRERYKSLPVHDVLTEKTG